MVSELRHELGWAPAWYLTVRRVRVLGTDWSEDDADSSEDNSADEVERPAARAAADGMSSDAESECLL